MTSTNTALIEAALKHIPANDRELWLKVGNALKTELGDSGFSLFDSWSATAENYKSRDTQAVWQSLQLGKNKISTLFHYAKQHGFTYDNSPKMPTLSPQQQAERQQQQQLAKEKAAQEKALHYAQAAQKALALWQDCAYIDNHHPYLVAKGISNYGLRVYHGNLAIGGMACQDSLVIPLMDNQNKIHSLQFISPTGDKRFLAQGNKQGHYHVIKGDTAKILICEGYATGASLHQATGFMVIVAFDASNLLAVSQTIRQAFTDNVLIICADNDHTKPKNTGLEAATKAALAVNGLLAYPLFSQAQSELKDFNDLAQTQGLDAVKTALDAAQTPQNKKAVPPTTDSTAPTENDLATVETSINNGQAVAKDADNHFRHGTHFYIDEKHQDPTKRGVYYVGLDKDGNEKRPIQICGVLRVLARTRNSDHRGHGYLLEWLDCDNHKHTWAMPAELFKGDCSEVRGFLMACGLSISPMAYKSLLPQYIQTTHTYNRVLCVNKTGWHEYKGHLMYVTPQQSYGQYGHEIVFQSESHTSNSYLQKSTLATWQQQLSRYCVGNSRLAFSVSAAFAGVLLQILGDESGGFHLRGDSSLGKSTAQHMACSVWGNRNFKKTWRATITGLEVTAAMYNDGLLVLDEIGQADPKDIGETVYMLANGQGKNRGAKTLIPRSLLEWRLLFLSSGEISLSQHMLSGGKTIKAGQELRLVDIPGDTESGHGLLETLHQFSHAKDLVEHINQQSLNHFGTAGEAFLNKLTPTAHQLSETLQQQRQQLVNELVPQGSGSQVLRVASRFALVAIAGELATTYGVTAWPQGEAKKAVKACFDAWLKARGSVDNLEKEYLLNQVKAFLEQYGESRFSDLCLKADTTVRTVNRVGYREPDGQGEGILFYCLPEAFKELIKGFDKEFAIKTLREKGWLKTIDSKHAQVQKRLPEGRIRVYTLLGQRIFDDI